MDEPESARCRELLGVSAGAGSEELERAFMKKNFGLIRNGSAVERESLRAAYEKLSSELRTKGESSRPAKPAAGDAPGWVGPAAGPVTPPAYQPPEADVPVFPLTAFDHRMVNIVVPPLLLGLIWLLNWSPLGIFLRGFHVWMHEFGHATAAWMCGRRALPLPFGWTPVEDEYSPFVYFGLLLLFILLFGAGWKERKVWPMLAAMVLAGLQYYMTWRMPEERQEFWWGAFGGVGGEFYLSALLMAFFFVELPEKFRWGICRYGFFLIGATVFLHITGFWEQVNQGLQDIPFGSMINGEDDQGGDMNKLLDDHGWTRSDIRHRYLSLGRCCWAGLGLVYASFALGLNRIPDKIVAMFSRENGEAG